MACFKILPEIDIQVYSVIKVQLQSNSMFESHIALKNLPPESCYLILESAMFVESVERTRDLQGNGESCRISPWTVLLLSTFHMVLPAG